jgi:hypothetical protein
MNADAKTAFQVEAAPPPELPSLADADPPEADLVRTLAEWLNQYEEAPIGLAPRTIEFCFAKSD